MPSSLCAPKRLPVWRFGLITGDFTKFPRSWRQMPPHPIRQLSQTFWKEISAIIEMIMPFAIVCAKEVASLALWLINWRFHEISEELAPSASPYYQAIKPNFLKKKSVPSSKWQFLRWDIKIRPIALPPSMATWRKFPKNHDWAPPDMGSCKEPNFLKRN